MLRRVFSTLALTAVLAAPAAAQTGPWPFWFNGEAGVYDEWEGSFNNSTWFQVFCVDFAHSIGHPTDNFNVWTTPFGSANKTFIEDASGGAWDSYRQAAQLASLMIGGIPSTGTAVEIQRAIWYAMGYNPSGAFTDEYNKWYNGVGLGVGEIKGSDVVISDADWYVINGDFRGTHRQELIAFRSNPPQETVPEPATMTLLATGLAGMAAARRRRKS